jgi:hypothetical protein
MLRIYNIKSNGAGAVAQEVEPSTLQVWNPEFKPQYCQKKKNQNKTQRLRNILTLASINY